MPLTGDDDDDEDDDEGEETTLSSAASHPIMKLSYPRQSGAAAASAAHAMSLEEEFRLQSTDSLAALPLLSARIERSDQQRAAFFASVMATTTCDLLPLPSFRRGVVCTLYNGSVLVLLTRFRW